LWSQGLSVAENNLESAAKAFGDIASNFSLEPPQGAVVWYNWGRAFSDLAQKKEGADGEKLFAEAFSKYQKAVEIKPDFIEAYNNWCITLMWLAQRKERDEKRNFLEEAKEKALKVEALKTGKGAYNLACIWSMLGDKKQCRQWLENGEKAGFLPTWEYASNDKDFESVRDEEWFKKLKWKA
jgi:tetratricopeptide (TPR) repeat protein